MTTCRFKDPVTNQIMIGKLNGQGVCEYEPGSVTKNMYIHFTPKDRKKCLEEKMQAPEIVHLTDRDLAGLYNVDKTFCTSTKDDFDSDVEGEKIEASARVTRFFKSSNSAILLDHINIQEIEKAAKKHKIYLDKSQFKSTQYVLKVLKKYAKIMIPFFPKLAQVLSMRPSVYFSHMLWFIGVFGDTETGIANIRQKFFQNYLNISERTERRLRMFFIKNKVFNCSYDRKTHYLQISVNWDGLDEFLRGFDEGLAIFPEEFRLKKEVKEEEVEQALEGALDKALDEAVQNEEPSKEPEEPTLDPVTVRTTKREFESISSYIKTIDKDASSLTKTQIETAASDLGCSNLFNPAYMLFESRYIGCDANHVLMPYFESGTFDARMILQALIREVPHLIPVPRDFQEVPSFYYQGEGHEMNPFWNPREKVVFGFTRRIAHLIGLSSYKKIISEISIVEWNSVEGEKSSTGKPLTQFVIATRNGVMAHMIGVFLTWLMSKYEEDSFEFRVIPLENGIIISNDFLP